ncbi:MAG: SPASM domain-containing protein [Deltaproteobacteria bacterium]|nr:SPASM domain-containing protein [Deltaproteobacteria bacterium]
MKNTAGGEFRQPGFWETIREAFLGVRRMLDCIQVEVTSHCPGRCSYCPHTTRRDQWLARDMDMGTFERLWPLMRKASRVHLQGWGEPLLHSGFFDMAALARKAGCAVSTTTCGLCMNGDIARKLADSGIDIVAFSLAGTDATSNAARHGVDFDRVYEAIGLLQAVRRSVMAVHLEIHFAYLMLASDIEAVRGLPSLAHRLGVHAAVVSTLDYIAEPGFEAEAFMPHEAGKLARAAAVLGEAEAEAKRLGVDFHWSLPRPDASGTRCRENVARSLYVAADGSVAPCVYLNVPIDCLYPDRRVFGNVNETEPLEIWESAAFRSFRDGLPSGDADPACRMCPKRFMI